MKKETALFIEQRHNVFVDHKSEMYTHGERKDTYGWQPVPDEWVKEAESNQD